MLKTTFHIFLLISLGLLLVNWGNVGHRNISYKSALSFSPAMPNFGVWADSLAMHASDADYRKSIDLNEGRKHYIDLDNYAEYNLNGKIASTYDSIVRIHGESFVKSNGTLPWATRIAYDSLKNCFKKRQWTKAMLFASDLGHYVADGHMPLHITSNYDGYATGQSGIHTRFESSMVSTYLTPIINYSGGQVKLISNINQYIMQYIYKNENYVDSVLSADMYAKNIAGNTSSTAYYTALWSKSQFTTNLFSRASHSLAEMIYSAWIEAGSPAFWSKTDSTELELNYDYLILAYPNPTQGLINIKEINLLKVDIYSTDGVLIESFYDNKIDINHLPNGMYILSIYSKNGILKKEKILLLR